MNVNKKQIIIMLLGCAFVLICCTSRDRIKDSDLKKVNKIEDSLMTEKEKLAKKFEEERLANEKKYDSLKIKGDSTKNKSNLSGFIGDTPIYNELKEK